MFRWNFLKTLIPLGNCGVDEDDKRQEVWYSLDISTNKFESPRILVLHFYELLINPLRTRHNLVLKEKHLRTRHERGWCSWVWQEKREEARQMKVFVFLIY